jgi:hypothetical protein
MDNANNMYTKEQAIAIATNYVLSVSRLQVLKITKYEVNVHGVPIVNVRCVTKSGDKTTVKVHISYGVVGGFGGFYKNAEEMLTAVCVNPNYDFVVGGVVKLSTSEKQELVEKERIAKEEKKRQDAFDAIVKRIQGEVDYAKKHRNTHKSARLVSTSKRVIKRYGIDVLESVIEHLDEPAQTTVQQCIEEMLQDANTKKLMDGIKQRTIKFSPALEGILDQIEGSIGTFEEGVKERVLSWMRVDKQYCDFSKERLEKEADDYIENQKAKLMYAAVRYLSELDITSVDNNTIRNHRNGFEGIWNITLSDNTKKVFETKTIVAEGYIQRAHYRYLTHLR